MIKLFSKIVLYGNLSTFIVCVMETHSPSTVKRDGYCRWGQLLGALCYTQLSNVQTFSIYFATIPLSFSLMQ